MFIRGFPDALSPGRLQLQPLGSLGRYLKMCHSCRMFSPSAHLAECKHVFCPGCAIVEPISDKERLKRSPQVFCFICKARVVSDFFEVDADIVNEMQFACPCGLNGPLREIKKHVWATARDHPTTLAHARLAREFDKLVSDVKTLKAEMSRITGFPTKKYFWIDIKQLIQDQAVSSKAVATSETIPWEVCGYSCEFFCQIKLADTDRYVGVFFRTSKARSSNAPWPMKKICVFNLYDLNGRPIRTGMIDTFKTGQRIDADLMAPSTKKISGRGLVKFYKVLTLMDKMDEILMSGRACFSAELREL